MNYRPDQKKLFLWDTWMFADPDGERMHLFFLANEAGRPWEWVGHAVSRDLVHWEELPPIQVRRPKDIYDVGVVGTGMVFRSPDNRFMMSYSSNLDGPQQKISFLHSADLVQWDKIWQEPVITAQPNYYETDGTKAVCKPPAFRDAFIHKRKEGYEALIGAHATEGPLLLRGCVARYRSNDPELKRWKPLPPLFGPGVTMLMELPEYFSIGKKHYLTWCTHSGLGVFCDTPSRPDCTGTFYAIADSYEGPYALPADNFLMGAAGGFQGYAGRNVMWRGQLLMYHHLANPESSFAFPKRILQNPDGTLKLGYWNGIEATHKEEQTLNLRDVFVVGENIQAGNWEVFAPDGIKGTIDGGGSLALIPGELEDIHLHCCLTLQSGTRFGICVREPSAPPPTGKKTLPGAALQGDLVFGEWQFGTPHHSWCGRINPVEVIRESPERNRGYIIDIIVRDIYFEAYVDGVWKFTRIIHEHNRCGCIGFFVENGSVVIQDIKVWKLESMPHPFRDV
ncbi:MAG: hypothetical protein ABIK20_06940 [Candidatus Omnitrophota bacterium]